MIVLEKKTKKKRDELLKKAKLFFGPEGEGLTISSEGNYSMDLVFSSFLKSDKCKCFANNYWRKD